MDLEHQDGRDQSDLGPVKGYAVATEIIKRYAKAETPGIIGEYLQVKTQPGRSVELRNHHGGGYAILRVDREENGTLRISGANEYSAPQLPNPSGGGDADNAGTITIRNRAKQYSMVAGMKLVEEKMGRGAAVKHETQEAVSRGTSQALQALGPGKSGITQAERNINQRLREGLAQVMDQETWDVAHLIGGRVTLARYNRVARNPAAYAELHRTNPGIAVWAINRHPEKAPVKHPGQLVVQARSELERNGLRKESWKTTSKMPTPAMRQVAKKEITMSEATLVLNAVARAGVTPEPDSLKNLIMPTVQRMRQYIRWDRFADRDRPGTERPNLQRVIDMVCRDTERVEELRDRATEIGDYVRNMSERVLVVGATTAGGLLRATEEWHRRAGREIRHGYMLAGAWNEPQEQMAWNSLLETGAEIPVTTGEYPGEQPGEYTWAHLGSTQALTQESRAMNHCVWSYQEKCVQGRSRLFSIRKDGEAAATLEIEFRGGRWQNAQLRGSGNAHPEPGMQTAAERVVDLYQKAWEGNRDRGHVSWEVEKEQTG